jgi:Domain of unknown function (DUF5916)/Carbohydrate family 9 binding domain-like
MKTRYARLHTITVVAVGLVLAPGGPLAAQRGDASDTAKVAGARRAPDGRLQVSASAAAVGSVHVDGRLDEPVWWGARAVSGFVQAEPEEGRPASERTEVRVAFDRDYLFIGAHMFDRDTAGIIANDIKRDFQDGDQDTFELIIDTFADRRNGYVFMTNPEGARSDWQISNEGREVNTSWNAPWSVKVRRVADGWVAEMAIPFRALRFTNGGTVWGINFSRRIRRKNEIDFWSPVPRSYTLTRVSLAGDLIGLPGASPGRDVRVKPYVLARAVRETGVTPYSDALTAGADIKVGLTDALTLDLTANPDFAQAEADVQQVNLTQFSQFFPEKRDFFLENAGLFYMGDAARNNRNGSTPTPDEDLIPFFSRSIGLTADGLTVPIRGGVRLTGRAAGLVLGALALRTGPQPDGAPGGDYEVLRVRRDVGRSSDVGAILLLRQPTGGASRDYNRVFGVDSNLRFLGVVDWSSYVLLTRSPDAGAGQYAWRTSLNREGNSTHIKLGVMSIGDGFRDDLGFYRRTGAIKWFLETGLRPRLPWLQHHGVHEMHPHIVWDYYTDQRGRMIAKKLHSGYTFFMNDGGYTELSVNPTYQLITDPFEIEPGVDSIPPGGYSWTEYMWRVNSDPSKPVSLSFTAALGGLWSGTQRTTDLSVTLQPSYHFRGTVGLQRTDARLDVPRARFIKALWTAQANYSFNPRMFIDALLQYDPATRTINTNVRFDFIHHPLSDVFLVYNEQRVATPDGGPAGRSVILKVTQMLAF